jgi:hypothetical protein
METQDNTPFLSQQSLLGRSSPTDDELVRSKGVRGAHYTGDRPTREQLDHLYNELKLSSSQIARMKGVTRKTVTNWLEMEGIPRRSNSEASRLRFQAQAQYVPEPDREDCLLDRAWEARPERRIQDKVACRLCFQQVSRLTGRTAHLAGHHKGLSGAEYSRLRPGHAHDCFQHSAGSNQLEVEKLMDDWCDNWATADEIRSWRRDPKLAQAQEYVGCLECGRKIFGGAEVQRHLKRAHNWSLEQYHGRYPGAPTGSLARRAMQTERSKELYKQVKEKLATGDRLALELGAAEKKEQQLREQLAAQEALVAALKKKQGGRTPEDERAERADELRRQRFPWDEVCEKIAIEFKVTTTVKALQELHRRWLKRKA